MGVTEVVRGHDLLSSSARQIYLQRLLGYPEPAYAHVPLLVAPDGRRLSKRDRDLDMEGLRERFGTPERLLGWVAAWRALRRTPSRAALASWLSSSAGTSSVRIAATSQ